jgi:hypothetical protein
MRFFAGIIAGKIILASRRAPPGKVGTPIFYAHQPEPEQEQIKCRGFSNNLCRSFITFTVEHPDAEY